MKHLALIAGLMATPAFAQEAPQGVTLLKGDVIAFEACFLQMMIDNPGNPMLEIIGPAICGERNIPMGQTCDALGYMLFESRAGCNADDLAYWQAQVEERANAAIADGRNGLGMMHDSGLERCDEVEAAGEDPIKCRIEINWSSSMQFIAADLVASLAEVDQ